MALEFARKHNPALLDTDADRRLLRLTCEGTGCEGVIVVPGDTRLSIIAERMLGDLSPWN